MKKFTKIIEQIESGKFFKVEIDVELVIPADNLGEASYIADSTMASIKNVSEYVISSVEETSKEYVLENMELYPGKQGLPMEDNKTPEEVIELSWETEFGDRTPRSTEKLEFYHNLRKTGFDGLLIHKVLKNKLLGE